MKIDWNKISDQLNAINLTENRHGFYLFSHESKGHNMLVNTIHQLKFLEYKDKPIINEENYNSMAPD